MYSKTRVIPVLCLSGGGLVKTVKFKNPSYVGDPINIVRIFNEKDVDEIVLLDIVASKNRANPDLSILADIASEAFMPLAYGGNVKSVDTASRILRLGYEKIVVNSLFAQEDGYKLCETMVNEFGGSSVVASLDVKKNIFGKTVLTTHSGSNKLKISILDHLKNLTDAGVGEILINNIDKDGTRSGYDLQLLKEVVDKVRVPVIACGGANDMVDFETAVKQAGVSAVASGSAFIYVGPHRAVLPNYPDRQDIFQNLP